MSQNEIPSEPLIYPEIDFNFEEKQEVTEHIHLGIKVDSFDSLLDELELEYKHVADRLRLLVGHPEFEIAISKYSNIQTGPKSQLGGAQSGLISSW